MPWEESDVETTGSDHPAARQENESFAASITGSAEFIADVDALLEEYRDIFSSDLGAEPADLPPLDVEIDTAKWHAPKNQGRARNQSIC